MWATETKVWERKMDGMSEKRSEKEREWDRGRERGRERGRDNGGGERDKLLYEREKK